MVDTNSHHNTIGTLRNGYQDQAWSIVMVISLRRCDSDGSSSVSLAEAVSCIKHEVSLHLTQALRENFFIFTAVDLNPRNG